MSSAIIFVHGAFCGGWAFDGFRAPFEAAGFETFAPDLPFHHHGADFDRLGQTGIKDFAEAIAHEARKLSSPPVLVGHSLGGLVVQLAAAKAPTAGVVMLAPSAPWGVPATTLDEHANAFGVSMLGDYWRRPVMPDYPTARRTTLDRLSRDDSRHAFSRFTPESGRALFETVQWWMDTTMSSAAPPYRINAPVLAISGARDHVNPSSTVRRIVNRFPSGQAQFHEMAHMSHWLMGEPEWPQVADRVLEWMAAHDIRPSAARAVRKKVAKVLTRASAV